MNLNQLAEAIRSAGLRSAEVGTTGGNCHSVILPMPDGGEVLANDFEGPLSSGTEAIDGIVITRYDSGFSPYDEHLGGMGVIYEAPELTGDGSAEVAAAVAAIRRSLLEIEVIVIMGGIRQDIRDGVVPVSLANYRELLEYVDPIKYGGLSAQVDPEFSGTVERIREVIDAVDQLIRDGALKPKYRPINSLPEWQRFSMDGGKTWHLMAVSAMAEFGAASVYATDRGNGCVRLPVESSDQLVLLGASTPCWPGCNNRTHDHT